MHLKKHLSFTPLRQAMSSILRKIPDERQPEKVNHSIHDCVMSGFACMFFQCPSVLEYQRRLKKRSFKNNLETQFCIHSNPSDTVIRDVIDSIPGQSFTPIFKDFFFRLQRGNQLKKYEFLPGLYLLALDGTQFFSSSNISCKHCLEQSNRGGTITHSHKAVQAAIVHPDIKQALPMMPEEIRNTDGTTKQDCEINAAKRLMPTIQKSHPRLHFIRTGDSLYAKQPFIEETLAQGDSFFFAVKPKDHVKMYEYIKDKEFEKLKDVVNSKGETLVYEWLNDVPLNGNDKTILINYYRCRRVVPQDDGTNKVTYIGSWITDLPIDGNTISLYVRGSRCRWRVENECFNTLKNQGYKLEHNFGHGEENLCFNFYVLTILAFLSHQILELTDQLYQKVRKDIGTLKGFWQDIRSVFKSTVFETWECMLGYLLVPENYVITRCLAQPPPQTDPQPA